MTPTLVIAMPGNETAAGVLAQKCGATLGQFELRAFPDGESYLRFGTDLTGHNLAIVCTLDHPNEKILELFFAAVTARDLGAIKVGLIAPYLAYMRQDMRFKSGEAITSREIAGLFSNTFDWLVTVDPHLHRYKSLNDIYSIPTRIVHAGLLMADWIKANVENPFIIGPDSESKQWVSSVAKSAGATFAVLEKIRRGDSDVEVSIENLGDLSGRTPVLVDDIISTGRTMLETIRLLKAGGVAAPVCVAVHGLFVADAYEALLRAGARVVTCNTVRHISNAIDVQSLLVRALQSL